MDDVTIWNLALGQAGTRTTVSSKTEASREARECALQYAPALEAVLQAAHWNFARAQVALTLLKDATATPPDQVPQPWLYEYAYPSDCTQLRYLMPTMDNVAALPPGAMSAPYFTGPPVPFIVGTDLDTQTNTRSKVILTNQAAAVGVYTARVTDPNMFDGQFLLALAAYLASRLALPLSGDKRAALDQFQMADGLTRAARASNGNEGLTIDDHVPDWIRVRGYAADWAFPPGSMFFINPQNLSFVS